MKSLGVIPARGNSTRIKNKNIVELGGKPLIAWTIEEAVKSKIDKVIVSTDSKEIADISEEYGAEIPFMRPKELATDSAHTSQVISHASKFYNDEYDEIITLQPTSPFRTYKHINECINTHRKYNLNSCISICKICFPPEWSIKLDERCLLFPFWMRKDNPFEVESQQLGTYYKPNGAIYITDRTYLKFSEKIVDIYNCSNYIMDEKSSFDIDTEMDYKIARELIKWNI